MPVDSIVRVSFNSVVTANQAANEALVGKKQGDKGSGPYTKVATATYSCAKADDLAVAQAVENLGKCIAANYTKLDFVSVSVVKHKRPRKKSKKGTGQPVKSAGQG